MSIKHAVMLVGVVVAGCNVPTEPRVKSVECSPTFEHLAIGQVMDVRCIVSWDKPPKVEDHFVVESSNPQVLNAERSGTFVIRMTARAAGFTTVTARFNSQAYTVNLEVMETGGPRLIAKPLRAEMTVGDTLWAPSFEAIDGDGTAASVHNGPADQTSSDISILRKSGRTTCGPAGLFSAAVVCQTDSFFVAVGPGEAEIRISYSGAATTVPVTVRSP